MTPMTSLCFGWGWVPPIRATVSTALGVGRAEWALSPGEPKAGPSELHLRQRRTNTAALRVSKTAGSKVPSVVKAPSVVKLFSLYKGLIRSWGKYSQNNTNKLLYSPIEKIRIFKNKNI